MLSKKYVKSRAVYKVTFILPAEQLPLPREEVTSVSLLGSFNDWDPEATPLTWHRKSKSYRALVELPPGGEYPFRYLVNGTQWCNDWAADGYAPNPMGSDNCLVSTPEPDAA